MPNPIFSAKEPSLGYLYQIQYGLLLLLTSKQENNAKVLIEALDDIELQTEDEIKLYQAKYHKKRDTNLTDRSPDFWKTIRVWCEQILDSSVDMDNTIFTLITTERISNNSVIFDIKNKNNQINQIDDILKKLNTIAEEIEKNNTNKMGYRAFKNLSPSQQKKLIQKIYVVDSSLDFKDIEKQIENELRLSAEPSKINALLDRITGWFLKNLFYIYKGKRVY